MSIVPVLAMTVTFAFAMAEAQTFKVLYTFGGYGGGAFPQTGLTIDAAGSLYGTTSEGGQNAGNIFQLTHSADDGWKLRELYAFGGGNDGNYPLGTLVVGPDRAFYGTTMIGGASCAVDPTHGCGTVFHFAPSPTPPLLWNERVIYRFAGNLDGLYPRSEITFDRVGNIYGTTWMGGNCFNPKGCGIVYRLAASGEGWTETVLWSFHGIDGEFLWGGVVPDPSGNLYGVAGFGGQYGYGNIYELSPAGSSWTFHVIHSFKGGSDGANPVGALIFGRDGKIYGTTSTAGGGGGTVFELSPTENGWSFNTLYELPGNGIVRSGPPGALLMDSAGSLYGVMNKGGRWGSVFKLTRSQNGWTYKSLHEFTAHDDGAFPTGSLVMDAAGNLYGMTSMGGSQQCWCGVIFEITP